VRLSRVNKILLTYLLTKIWARYAAPASSVVDHVKTFFSANVLALLRHMKKSQKLAALHWSSIPAALVVELLHNLFEQ